jgi:mRNA interferase HigB
VDEIIVAWASCPYGRENFITCGDIRLDFRRLSHIVIWVRVVKPSRVREYAKQYPDASPSLMAWLKSARNTNWKNLQQVRLTYGSADGVTVRSGKTVTVFNIGGNKYRLVVSIHYAWAMVYVLRFMTHAQYNKDKWKAEL